MQCLDVLGFRDYYYLDKDKIYNINRRQYLKEVSEYRYKLVTAEGKNKTITIKEIYKRLYNKVFCIDTIKRLEGEEFKEIEGTEGNYAISNMGRVISYKYNHAIILKPTVTSKGYERLQIRKNGKKCNKFIHCLVATAWLGSPQSLDVDIHHIDFNKRNNRHTNLQYISKDKHIKIHTERREQENAKLQQ